MDFKDFVWNVFVSGVWGPTAHHNNDFWGGERCAGTSTNQQKFIVNFATVI